MIYQRKDTNNSTEWRRIRLSPPLNRQAASPMISHRKDNYQPIRIRSHFTHACGTDGFGLRTISNQSTAYPKGSANVLNDFSVKGYLRPERITTDQIRQPASSVIFQRKDDWESTITFQVPSPPPTLTAVRQLCRYYLFFKI